MDLNQKVSRKDFLKTGIIGAAVLGVFAKAPLTVGAATIRDNLGVSSSGSGSGSGGSSTTTNNGLVIKKATAPNNTDALWIDISQQPRAIAKYYNGTGWVPLASVWGS